jgi:hypothetical protein
MNINITVFWNVMPCNLIGNWYLSVKLRDITSCKIVSIGNIFLLRKYLHQFIIFNSAERFYFINEISLLSLELFGGGGEFCCNVNGTILKAG